MMNLIIELGIVCSLVFLEQQIDLENINYDKFLYPVKNTKAKNRSLNSSLSCLRPHQPGTRLRIGEKRGNRRARKKNGRAKQAERQSGERKGGGGSAALPSSPVHCSTRFARLNSFSCLIPSLTPQSPPLVIPISSINRRHFQKAPFFPVTSILS